MIYTQKRQPSLCDEFGFKIYSGYTCRKQLLPWGWNWEKPRSLDKAQSFRRESSAFFATTQFSYYKNKEEGKGNVSYAADQFKLARALKSHHHRCLEETVIPHTQSYVFIYASTLFLYQLLFKSYAAIKSCRTCSFGALFWNLFKV